MKYGVEQTSGYSHGMKRVVREFDSKEDADSFARKMNHYEQYKDRGPLDKYVVVELPTIDENYKESKGNTMKLHKDKLKEMIRKAIREQAPPSADVAKLGDKLGKASGVGSMQSKINTPQEAAAAIVDALKGYTLKPGEDIVALTKAINMIKGQKKEAPQPGQPGLATETRDKKKLDPVGKEDPDVDNDGDVDDSDSYLRNRRKVIGKEVKKEQKGNWIKGAIEKPGALRKTAKEKGLLKGDEKLSKTDLDKLEKMGGKTAKRARLAKTLKGLGEASEHMSGLKRYHVTLKNIDWDTDLKDGSEPMSAAELDLPKELVVRVDAFSKDEALDAALDRVSDDYGFLINGANPEFHTEPKEPEFMDVTKIVREMVKEEIARYKSKR